MLSDTLPSLKQLVTMLFTGVITSLILFRDVKGSRIVHYLNNLHFFQGSNFRYGLHVHIPMI